MFWRKNLYWWGVVNINLTSSPNPIWIYIGVVDEFVTTIDINIYDPPLMVLGSTLVLRLVIVPK
jgi:hypothetical protein